MPVIRSGSTRDIYKAPLSAVLRRHGRERRERWSQGEDPGDFMPPHQDEEPSHEPSESSKGKQPEPQRLPSRAGYDTAVLLDLCDTIRSSLHGGRPEDRWEEAMGFLAALLRDEEHYNRAIEFETIRDTHLDKLISDLMDPKYRHPRVPIRFSKDVERAETLERKWVERFRGPYFNMEQNRYRDLPKTGRLRDVALNPNADNSEERWQAKEGKTLSELEGNLEIEPGHWWLNLACAHRDGIVGSAREKPTKGKYGVAALPLLTGQEKIDEGEGTLKYVRQGRITDIHVSLISQVGATFRILRGHHLRSPYAPKVGIRYDGLYTIRRYSQWFNEASDRHHMMLTLERVEDQKPIEDILHIPRPSEMDDWELYEKYEGEAIKKHKGNKALLD
ncbi:PUA-like domain-containing protein [Fusarium oxysporum II5]|uniref:YDG domain-containing protein n=6 Tax=Fusarium oxysporum species complex TaxID=171631 RepID=N1RHS4_FUSC4|nr:uncharacterized protein FOIG_05684 [Fusarium odoratissimum NRRL 54006]EMT63972.1 hypothetical protein FOC4_g10010449 [Fusarium odoratissimum]EXM04158.1 hypothetical protein FOIG_05684 [Fusarium odoratissimum NRRL 54006]KAK2131628.1 PUA-like domain-containing protein [Fusarium oxysporum II5]TXC09194.1 hypothetical protein FocTR4_00005519 [Fusarium oxysporum f. sp. cubense]